MPIVLFLQSYNKGKKIDNYVFLRDSVTAMDMIIVSAMIFGWKKGKNFSKGEKYI
jgi:hypothetical protein